MTSGTHDFDPSFDDILQDAAGMVGGGPILAEELISARRGLDVLLTRIQNRNLFLHKIETTTVPTVTAVASYAFDKSVSDLLHLTVNTSTEASETVGQRLGFQQWMNIPNKSLEGRPLQWWFDRHRQGGSLRLWPTPDKVYNLNITLQKTPEDTVKAFDSVDVPRRFIPALTFGLAYWVGLRRANRVPADRLALLKREFDESVREAMDEDRERASVRISLRWS